MAYTGDHIENHELPFYFDRIFQKVTLQLTDHQKYQEDEIYMWASVMFQKFKIQFYSIMQLTYKMTRNPLEKFEYRHICCLIISISNRDPMMNVCCVCGCINTTAISMPEKPLSGLPQKSFDSQNVSVG